MAIQQSMDAILGLGRSLATMSHDAAQRQRIEGLVRAHFPLVWRYLRRLGLSDADADDAAQQVFLTTSRKLSQVDSGFERAFVLGVAVRVARDVRKAEQRRRTEPDSLLEHAPDPGPDPERALERQRACALLDQLLEELDDEARAVFALYEIEGLNMREIADALAKPAGTVASQLRRGRSQFEAAVERHRASEHTRRAI